MELEAIFLVGLFHGKSTLFFLNNIVSDSVATCDTVVIDVWNCVDSRVKAKLQGSFTCTVKRLLILQAITEDGMTKCGSLFTGFKTDHSHSPTPHT